MSIYAMRRSSMRRDQAQKIHEHALTSMAALRNRACSSWYIASLSYKKLVEMTLTLPFASSCSFPRAFERFPTRSPRFVPRPRRAVWRPSGDAEVE